MPTSEQFLNLLADREMVDKATIDRLRRHVANSPKRATPQQLAAWLVEHGHITARQAEQVLGQQAAVKPPAKPEPKQPPAQHAPPPPPGVGPDDLELLPDETSGSELGLAPIEDESPRGAAKRPVEPDDNDGDLDLLPLDDDQSRNRARSQSFVEAISDSDEEIELLPDEQVDTIDEAHAQDDVEEDIELFPTGPSSKARGRVQDDDEEHDDGGDLELLPLVGDPGLVAQAPTPPPRAPSAPPRETRQSADVGPPPGARSAPHPTVPSKSKEDRGPWRQAVPNPSPTVDDLFGDRLVTGATAADSAAAPPPGARRGPRPTWESPYLLLGAGALLALVILALVLVWSLRRQSGDELLELADRDYRAGAYSQAIKEYDDYLDRFPNHESASAARVRRGLAELRQSAETARDWNPTLDVANAVLTRIAVEDDFSSAHSELAGLLPNIAEGLSKQAAAAPSQPLIDRTNEALALVDKYVPAEIQPGQQLTEIRSSVAVTVRNLARNGALTKVVVDLTTLTASGEPEKAYAARADLVSRYPELVDDATLVAALHAITEAERKAVRMVDAPLTAVTSAAETPIRAEIALAVDETTPTGAPRASGPTAAATPVPIYADGAVYAMQAGTGDVLWRNFVGFDLVAPAISLAGGDVLVAATAPAELRRLQSGTGAIVWRLPLDAAPVATPIVVRERAFVPLAGGRLLVVDWNIGSSPGYVQLPQSIEIPPAVDPRGKLLYQLGEHSTLFVIELEGLTCVEAITLGHESASIAAPPAVAGRYLLVAENRGASDSVLHVLLADAEGRQLKAVEHASLRGHVWSPPVTSGRMLHVATDRGAVVVYELAAPGESPALKPAAEKPAEDTEPIARFPLVLGDQLIVAGDGLTRFDVQSARGRLSPRWGGNPREIVLNVPHAAAGSIVSTAREEGIPGVIVSAVAADDGRVVWRTRLAVPPAGPPVATTAGDRLIGVSERGNTYALDAAQLDASHVVEQAADPQLRLQTRLPDFIAIGAGGATSWLAAAAPKSNPATGGAGSTKQQAAEAPGSLYVVDLAKPMAAPRRVDVPAVPSGGVAASDAGVLVPTVVGQVFAIDPASGAQKAAPFQPRVDVNRSYNWSAPVAIDGRQFAISDGATGVFRVELVDQPAPHWKLAASRETANPIAGQLAVTANRVYGVDSAERLVAFELPALAPAGDWQLGAPIAWGPVAAGEGTIILATDAGEVICLAADEIKWRSPPAHGPLAGVPIVVDGNLVAASRSGSLARLNLDDGTEQSAIETGRPLLAGPVAVGAGVVVVGHDGTLYRVDRP